MAIIQSYGTNISVSTNDLVPFATNAVLNGRVMHDNPTVFNFNKSEFTAFMLFLTALLLTQELSVHKFLLMV